MITINKSAAIIIQNRKLLLTRSSGKQVYVAPGGKPEDRETAIQALMRELEEELTITIQPQHAQHFGTFTALSAGSGDKMLTMDVFVVSQRDGTITAANEIEEILRVDSNTTDIEIGSIFAHEVIPQLKAHNLID